MILFLFITMLFLIGERWTGPMSFRLIMQPIMAAIFAIRGGINDAREGRQPYLRAIIMDKAERYNLLHEGWKSIGRIFLIAVVMDLIYQWIEYRWIFPIETLFIAVVLAIVPYLVLRGPVNRIWRRRIARQHEALAVKE
jgi:hypothetical protein